ncbi:uncharacterized protein LOC103709528 [Phoenix dactylifera]|uniref:Uncharacterized protein LOC103709528 n=1 Tax=Phoenix dactylifera TaxID=42345 RepID=A0A8B7C749_PHODC|nr:uncharacterized protein LOC103709528 [Phoenix dactylifera]
MASSSAPYIPLLDSPEKTLAKRKKDPASVQEKLAFLARDLRPVPFSPAKPLASLSPHEPLLRALGLWDFARLPLDRAIRSDLLSLLIAHYDPRTHRSLVRNARVALGRAAFARALALPLSLPVEKEEEFNAELFSGKAAVATVMDFMMNWIVFLDDACVLPAEVVAATRLVKDGRPQKVDWAGLVWAMVEREILDAPRAGRCYYASHLQCLMKRQRPQLFEEEGEPEMDMELEQEIKVGLVEDEDCAGNAGPELGLENCGLRSTLRLCRDVDAGDGVKEEPLDLERKDVGVDDVGVKCENLNKGEEFLAMRTDPVHKKVMLDNGPSAVFLFWNYCMGVAGEVNYDDDARVFDCIVQQKRMQSRRSCEHTQPPVDACMDQVQDWMVKAKMMYLKKKQECMKAHLELQHLNQMLQQKDQIIWSLEKKREEEMKKRKLEACQFDHELRAIGHLVHDYRKALKKTRSAFAEYRKRFPEGDKPLYKDACGTGGAAVSTRELEMQSMKKEAEMRHVAAKMINDFQKVWFAKLGGYAKWATELATRLVNLKGETKILQERFAIHDLETMIQ